MEKAILAGPCVGEMYWELGRFASHVIWLKKKKHPNAKLIVLTRPDRFDMYGKYADILVPLRIDGDGDKFKSDCFRLRGYDYSHVRLLAKRLHDKYSKRYKIVSHVYPNLERKQWANKNLYKKNEMFLNKFQPRNDNKLILDRTIPDDRPLVIIAPRHRKGVRRNWPHWQALFNLIAKSDLRRTHYFVLCGRVPDHTSDNRNRFFDINNFEQTRNTSLIGFTIECMKRACFTVGSQSGIPNISLLYGVDVLEWGHQKSLHTQSYNPFKTPVTFIENPNYDLPVEKVFNKMNKLLAQKGKDNERKHMVEGKRQKRK